MCGATMNNGKPCSSPNGLKGSRAPYGSKSSRCRAQRQERTICSADLAGLVSSQLLSMGPQGEYYGGHQR